MNTKIKMLILLVITLISSFFLLGIIGKKLNPIMYRYANVEVKRITSNIINSSVNEVLATEKDLNLFELTKNNKDEIEVLDYNTKEVNRILKKITQKIQKRLLDLEDGKTDDLYISDNFKNGSFKNIKGGILCEIPTGSLKNNSLFSNIGPDIPIKMSFLGQVQTNLNTKVTNYGINNLMVEVTVHVEVEEQITMPTMSKNSIIKIDAPLTIKIIQGVVPNYYFDGINSNSNTYNEPLN